MWQWAHDPQLDHRPFSLRWGLSLHAHMSKTLKGCAKLVDLLSPFPQQNSLSSLWNLWDLPYWQNILTLLEFIRSEKILKQFSHRVLWSFLGVVNVMVKAEAVASHISCDNEIVTVPERGRIDVVTRSVIVKVGAFKTRLHRSKFQNHHFLH